MRLILPLFSINGCLTVFVVEFGRWDIRGYLEEIGDRNKDFEKYIEQMLTRFYNANQLFPKGGVQNPDIEGFVFIGDLEDYSVRQLGHIPSTSSNYYQITKKNTFET